MDEKYIEIFMEPLYECLNYNPKFGHSIKEEGYTLDEFLQLYGEDPFYSWIGLDSPYMFAAHKAAGCMTSIYRQIGIGCERLFRQIIFDTTGYEDYASTQWSYKTKTQAGKEKVLALDGRLEIADIKNNDVKKRVRKWMSKSCEQHEQESLRFLVLILQGNSWLRFGGVLQDELTIYPRKGWQSTRTIIQRP
jgi:hypothetical protein